MLNNLFIPLSRDWIDSSARADDFIRDGERVVSLGLYRGTYKKTGRRMMADFAHVGAVRKQTIVRFDMYTDTVKILEAMQPQ